MVHNEAIPPDIAKQVKTIVEDGLEAPRRKQEDFFHLAEKFRAASDPKEVPQLGDQLGRMVFGGGPT